MVFISPPLNATIIIDKFNIYLFQKNIGQKILKKQGWKEGQGLGKHLQGSAYYLLEFNFPFDKLHLKKS